MSADQKKNEATRTPVCPYCKRDIDVDDLVCPHCGKPLTGNV